MAAVYGEIRWNFTSTCNHLTAVVGTGTNFVDMDFSFFTAYEPIKQPCDVQTEVDIKACCDATTYKK